MVINCSQPESEKARKYTLIFERFNAFGGFQFKEGHSYYYISEYCSRSRGAGVGRWNCLEPEEKQHKGISLGQRNEEARPAKDECPGGKS